MKVLVTGCLTLLEVMYINHKKFAAYVAFSFYHIILVPNFIIVYMIVNRSETPGKF